MELEDRPSEAMKLDKECKPWYGARRAGVLEAWGADRSRKHGEESKRIRECGEEVKG